MADFYIPCAYNAAQKHAFHAAGSKRLRALATALELKPGSFDVRSNPGGIAVSGEVALHGQNLYVQICQPATGADTGILIRVCNGRKDYTNYAPLSCLDDIPALAERCRSVLAYA